MRELYITLAVDGKHQVLRVARTYVPDGHHDRVIRKVDEFWIPRHAKQRAHALNLEFGLIPPTEAANV